MTKGDLVETIYGTVEFIQQEPSHRFYVETYGPCFMGRIIKSKGNIAEGSAKVFLNSEIKDV